MFTESRSPDLEPTSRGGVTWAALEAYRTPLKLLARRKLLETIRTREAASDLVQETILRAGLRLRGTKFDSPGRLCAWLRAILLNVLRDDRKHRFAGKRTPFRVVRLEPETPFEPAETSTGPVERASRAELRRALQSAVEKLGPRDRQVFDWRHEEGCSFEEIGARLGIGADGGRKVWARAIEKLRDDLGPYLHESA